MKKTILALVIAVVAGLPIGWIVAMLLTPTLWRLEPVLHMELAGHSGPSDWVFIVIWIVVVSVLFLILRALFKTGVRD
jgi:ABC-type antimicrobial peptide transport system permease subunit